MLSDLIHVTPDQRKTYDAAYAVTAGGTVRWTGVLRVADLDTKTIQSAMNRLFDLKALTWARVGNSRSIEILAKPERLVLIEPRRVPFAGKLYSEPAIKKSPGGASRTDCEAGSNGVRRDTGAFSQAFVAALGLAASYRSGSSA